MTQPAVAIWIPVSIGAFNIFVVLVGAAVIWGKVTTHITSLNETVKGLNGIIHPDPGQSESKLLTAGDCDSCRKGICKSIKDLDARMEGVEASLMATEVKRNESAKIYMQRWESIDKSLKVINGKLP